MSVDRKAFITVTALYRFRCLHFQSSLVPFAKRRPPVRSLDCLGVLAPRSYVASPNSNAESLAFVLVFSFVSLSTIIGIFY